MNIFSSSYMYRIVTHQMVLADYGTQEHVLTPLQTYLHKKIDNFYNIKPYELDLKYEPSIPDGPKEKPFISIRRVDVNPPDQKK